MLQIRRLPIGTPPGFAGGHPLGSLPPGMASPIGQSVYQGGRSAERRPNSSWWKSILPAVAAIAAMFQRPPEATSVMPTVVPTLTLDAFAMVPSPGPSRAPAGMVTLDAFAIAPTPPPPALIALQHWALAPVPAPANPMLSSPPTPSAPPSQDTPARVLTLSSGGDPPSTPNSAPVSQAPTPAPPPAPAGPLSSEELAIAQAAGIFPDRANFDALVEEMAAVHIQNAIGPGVQQPKYVSELQQMLASWGYAVQVNGQFDKATADAVIKFKRDRGACRSLWHFADGSTGFHPFVDEAMKAALRNKIAEDLGSGAGHWDELGIFRPSKPMADAVAQTHSWVYDQPMRDGTGPVTVIVEQALNLKLQNGHFVAYTKPDGSRVPIPRQM